MSLQDSLLTTCIAVTGCAVEACDAATEHKLHAVADDVANYEGLLSARDVLARLEGAATTLDAQQDYRGCTILVQRLTTSDLVARAAGLGRMRHLRHALTTLGVTGHSVATVTVTGLQTHVVQIMAAAAASELWMPGFIGGTDTSAGMALGALLARFGCLSVDAGEVLRLRTLAGMFPIKDSHQGRVWSACGLRSPQNPGPAEDIDGQLHGWPVVLELHATATGAAEAATEAEAAAEAEIGGTGPGLVG